MSQEELIEILVHENTPTDLLEKIENRVKHLGYTALPCTLKLGDFINLRENDFDFHVICYQIQIQRNIEKLLSLSDKELSECLKPIDNSVSIEEMQKLFCHFISPNLKDIPT